MTIGVAENRRRLVRRLPCELTGRSIALSKAGEDLATDRLDAGFGSGASCLNVAAYGVAAVVVYERVRYKPRSA